MSLESRIWVAEEPPGSGWRCSSRGVKGSEGNEAGVDEGEGGEEAKAEEEDKEET